MKNQNPITQSFNLPETKQAEESVIGSLLLESTAIAGVLDILTPAKFNDEKLGTIYEAALNLYEKNTKIDPITVMTELQRMGKLDFIGGAYALSILASNVSSSVNIKEHAGYVHECHARKQAYLTSLSIAQRAFDFTEDVDDIINSAVNGYESIAENSDINANGADLSTITPISLQEYGQREINASKGLISGIRTGLAKLDYYTGGFLKEKLYVLAARPAMGKALRMNAKILTPKGWVLNKDLKIGDAVCSVDGSESRVTGIFPQGRLNTYSVKFSDGRETICCGSHLWRVDSSRHHKVSKRIMSTLEIKEAISTPTFKNQLSIPMYCGEYGDMKDFRVPPYLLGALLGDWVFDETIQQRKPDQFVSQKIYQMLGTVVRKVGIFENVCFRSWWEQEYVDEYKRMNLYGIPIDGHFIPPEYMDASRIQRLDLLNGLMDTSGIVEKRGGTLFYASGERLAKDVQMLCWSLGYKCTYCEQRNKGDKKRYVLYIVAPNPHECFSIPNKRFRTKERKTRPLSIVSVTPTGKMESCQCISVSHSEALYITDDYIVTHNTAMMIHFARHAAMGGAKVALFSLEMGKISLTDRLIVAESGVDATEYKSGRLDNEGRSRICDAVDRLNQLPITIFDSASFNMRRIKSELQKLKRKGKCDIAMIDYLQLIDSRTGGKGYNRENEIAQCSRTMKLISMELQIPVIVLSQLSRKSEDRADKKPLLADLRESGAIEQDADMVMFVHRPEYYDKTAKKGLGNLIIAKQRDGMTGEIDFSYNSSLTQIRDYDSSRHPY